MGGYTAGHSIRLLEKLVRIPSYSKEEQAVADVLEQYLIEAGGLPQRIENNLILRSKVWKEGRKTLLLNSHMDTVKPQGAWESNPHEAIILKDRLIGLGSNDAGGCLVSLIHAFLNLQNTDTGYNLVLACTAEEEISGKGGIESVWGMLGKIDAGIVGEPTSMQLAVAEKGLLVIDAYTEGKSGHAARNEGINALYLAVDDINRIRNWNFSKESPWLGPVKMTVTMIQSGTQHNVVPAECQYVIDIRVNDLYTFEEIMEELSSELSARLIPRSLRLKPSHLPEDHPLFLTGKALGWNAYGSPTLSDQALIPAPTVKLGPGESARSHTPNEYILFSELEAGLAGYQTFLQKLKSYWS
ncbi:MAG TPA: M20/M25/M40 family metallo-hydrolase [Saprospiraceae bacterium]|nr:M20/M25/M40 family metallo-hydrolase [Saprospiraceae bacterium]